MASETAAALSNRQDQLTGWIEKLTVNEANGLPANEAEMLLLYSGKFQGDRFFIADQSGAEVDPAELAPQSVRRFWFRIAGTVSHLLALPMDCPESLQETRAILPYLQEDALKAAQRGNTAWVEYRQAQIQEYQAKQDQLVNPAVTREANRNNGHRKRSADKRRQMLEAQAMRRDLRAENLSEHKIKSRIMKEYKIGSRAYSTWMNHSE